MHDYNTILGVIELRLSKVSYDAVQKRYRIGQSGIALIMNRYNDSGLSLDDLRQMPASKLVDLIYPKENLRHKDIPLPDFEKIHEQMIQMGKHADLSFLWIDYKKEHPNGYQLAQFYKLYRDFLVDTYGTSKTSMPVERIPGEKMYIDWVGASRNCYWIQLLANFEKFIFLRLHLVLAVLFMQRSFWMRNFHILLPAQYMHCLIMGLFLNILSQTI